MAIFRCKMCGGDLEVVEGSPSCTCEFCGTKQTVPTVKDEGLQTLFNRANVLRMKSEFDKAAEVYEKILQRSESEAEAYWGLILCKYGIEYVEDPKTFKRIPTCHRTSYDPVTTDEDYKNALKYADAVQRGIYETEAAAIDEIQKGILALAQKEDPYDVFICYKETDENGNRTQDSVIANDIYYQLTHEGLKVFYAAITLEDKLGKEYEPYIFSALNTAKVLLALGTKPEYFNAVWVKNEWSRFLKLMKKDRTRLLIPCYRDMDPYELPEEFAHLQAQDMAKIGFIADLVRGIKKVIGKDASGPAAKETVVVQQGGSTTAEAQITRGNIALEDSEWEKADTFFEEALNLDPKCAEAYLGKLMAARHRANWPAFLKAYENQYAARTTENLEACPEDSAHIEKSIEENILSGYLDADTIRRLYDYDRHYDSALSCRKSQKAKQEQELAGERLLNRARQYAKGDTAKQIEDGLAGLTAVLDKRIAEAQEEDKASIARVKTAYAAHLADADMKAQQLSNEAHDRQEKQYRDAAAAMKAAGDVASYERAKTALTAMNGYKDSEELAEQCRDVIDRLQKEKQQKEAREAAQKAAKSARKRKTTITVAVLLIIACLAAAFVVTKVIIPNNKYNAAVALMDSGDYTGAIEAFTALGGYSDSSAKITECEGLILERDYNAAVALMDDRDYEGAIAAFEALGDYSDSESLLVTAKSELLANAEIGDMVYFGTYEQDNDTTNGAEEIEWLVLDKDGNRVLVISRYGLDCQPYNTEWTDVTWEACTLRTWLNGTFLNTAFTAEEQAMIPTVTVSADKNPNYDTDPGNDTEDKVFLLSIPEAEEYFAGDDARMCAPTVYAIGQGAFTDDDYKVDGEAACWWWLRSPGYDSNYAVFVFSDGSVYNFGYYVDLGNYADRPALWIDLAS